MKGCDEFARRIDDYLDGGLSPEERRIFESHLAACVACSAARDEIAFLRRMAEALPVSLEPSRDLWGGIEARIRRTGDRPASSPAPQAKRIPAWAFAAAAVFALCLLGGAALWVRKVPPPATHASPAGASLVQPAGLREMDAAYGPAREDLLRVLRERKEILRPETRAVVEENLALIDQAVRHIRGALERDPANRALMEVLGSTYRQEQELLRRAATLPADA